MERRSAAPRRPRDRGAAGELRATRRPLRERGDGGASPAPGSVRSFLDGRRGRRRRHQRPGPALPTGGRSSPRRETCRDEAARSLAAAPEDVFDVPGHLAACPLSCRRHILQPHRHHGFIHAALRQTRPRQVLGDVQRTDPALPSVRAEQTRGDTGVRERHLPVMCYTLQRRRRSSVSTPTAATSRASMSSPGCRRRKIFILPSDGWRTHVPSKFCMETWTRTRSACRCLDRRSMCLSSAGRGLRRRTPAR